MQYNSVIISNLGFNIFKDINYNIFILGEGICIMWKIEIYVEILPSIVCNNR